MARIGKNRLAPKIFLPLPKTQYMTTELKISILSDKLPSNGCEAEHGLSFLVEADGRVLFDTGASNLFLRNATRMGVDIENVDTVVLSHGHYDHGNGLQWVSGKRIVMHPEAFAQRISGRSGRNILMAVSRQTLEAQNTIVATREPFRLTDKMTYLGEIERTVPFEAECSTPFHFADGTPDPVADDSGLAVATARGLFVVSGCAHAGICNIVEQARRVTGIDKVFGVIGGFHLTAIDNRLAQTIDYLKNVGAEVVMPSHCTGDEAIAEFRRHFRGELVKTGLTFEF